MLDKQHDTASTRPVNHPGFLRLHTAQEIQRDQMRLGEAFETFLLPQLVRGKCSKAHITTYRTTLKHWRELSEDPPVVEIDDDCLQAFVDDLMRWHKANGFRGNSNTRKKVEYLRHILRACCPRGVSNKRGRPKGEHIIDEMPMAVLPDADLKRKRVADLDEIGKAYEACPSATWPQRDWFAEAFGPSEDSGPGPGAAWRLLLVMSYSYGPRTEDLLGLRWDHIQWEPTCPAPEVSKLESPWGWLVFTPSKTRRHKPSPLHLPLTECARRHLEAQRQPYGLLFDFPANKRALHEQREAIWREAGIDRFYTFQELRKTCSVTWNDLRAGLGEHVLGHAERGVNAVSYDTDLRRLCQFAPQFPYPETMLDAVGIEAAKPSARADLAGLILEMAEKLKADH